MKLSDKDRNGIRDGMLKDKRLANEIRHGEFLSKSDPVEVWNWSTPAGRQRWARRVKMLSSFIAPSMVVLEVGCGTGMLTRELANTGAAITAIDISEDLLKIAGSAIETGKVTFKNENAYHTDFADNTFDAIIGSSVLHHLDTDKAVREFYRILKKNGFIVFTEPNMMNPQIMIQKNIPYIKKKMGDSPDETAFFRWSLKNKLKRSGFGSIEITPFDFLHPAIPAQLMGFLRPVCNAMEKIPLVKEIAGSLYIVARK